MKQTRPFRLRIYSGLVCLLLIGLLVPGQVLPSGAPGQAARLQEYEYVLPRMGTEFRILLYHSDPLEAEKSALAAFDRVEELEDIFSDYRERSEINRLCQVAVGKPTGISPELFLVLERSLRISLISGGAFDVTIGPVVQLWRQARRNKSLPDPEALKKARQKVGFTNIVLDSDAKTAMLKLPGMKIDFGGIAKGYAADQALAVLISRGIRRALVDGGGDMAVGDAPPGRPGWKILIRNPAPKAADTPDYLTLSNVGVATSGDAFQYLEVNGRRYSHIIDPASGVGLSDSASVTIIAPDGMTADALATAVSVMPVRDGIRMVESMSGVFAAVVHRGPAGLQRSFSAGFPDTKPSGVQLKSKTAAR